MTAHVPDTYGQIDTLAQAASLGFVSGPIEGANL